MQMLPAILPNAPSATARPGKASEPTTEGVFQSVLNQETGQTGKSESRLAAKQSEGKTAKHKAADIAPSNEQQSDSVSEEIPSQEAQALAAAQNLVPICPDDFQEKMSEELELPGAEPFADMVNAQTVLPPSKEQADDMAMPDQRTESAMQSGNRNSKPDELLSNVLSSSAVSAQTRINNDGQQIATVQSPLLSAAPSGTVVTGITNPQKAKAASLGDHRFEQLLGRSDAPVSGTSLDGPSITTPATAANPALGLNNRTGMQPAILEETTAGMQPFIQNASVKETKQGSAPADMDTRLAEPADTSALNSNLLTGEETQASQAADLLSQGSSALTEALSIDNDGISPGTNQGINQASLAGHFVTPAATSTPVLAAQGTPLQQTSSFTVPEQNVMEQIIARSSLRELEGKRQLTVELHPEDLGQVKLNLVQEQDRLQLHLQAQSSEVRDLLEKHLPRLQEALQQQGLRLETIQVSVDAQRNNNAQGFFERQQQHASRNPWQHTNRSFLQSEEQHLPAQVTRHSSVKGLSLRI